MQRFNDARGLIEILFLAGASVLILAFAIMWMPKKGDVVVYDCSIAEISPDIPIEVKEKCRKLRAEKL
jgi:hypothetical protein